MKKLLSSILLLVTTLFSLNMLWFSPALADNAKAVTYLQAQPLGDWGVMGLKAAGQTVDVSQLTAVSVTANEVSGYLAVEKRILALTAAGQDPTTYSNQNLVAALKSWTHANQIGDDQSFNDDVWGILALRSVNTPVDDAVISGAKQFLLQHQNTDGGWSFGVGGSSDTNSTASTILALIEAGVSTTDQVIVKALDYLHATQNTDGGMPFAVGGASDAASDAWVAWAVKKVGQTPAGFAKNGQSIIGHLRLLQATDGSFNWMSGQAQAPALMTAYALVALYDQTLPIGRVTPAAPTSGGGSPPPTTSGNQQDQTPTSVHVRIEGSAVQICHGDIVVNNPMTAIENLASTCNYSYVINPTTSGPYLRQIQNDSASGLRGWLYLVNGAEATLNAAAYQLKLGDDLLWYYGVSGMRSLRVRTDKTTASTGEQVNVWVEWQGTDGVWNAVDQAEVIADGQTYPTVQGQVHFQWSKLGEHIITAHKDGYIRPAPATVTVGAASERVTLSVDVESSGSGSSSGGGGGGGGGTPTSPAGGTTPEIAFTVSTAQVVISHLQAGQVGQGQVVLKNTGLKPLHFEDTVSGDAVLVQNVRVGGGPWQTWQIDLISGATSQTAIDVPIPVGTAIGTKRGEIIFWATPKR